MAALVTALVAGAVRSPRRSNHLGRANPSQNPLAQRPGDSEAEEGALEVDRKSTHPHHSRYHPSDYQEDGDASDRSARALLSRQSVVGWWGREEVGEAAVRSRLP